MSALSPQSSGLESPEASRPPPNRRRDKPQLSCTLCKRRKLKCDRNHPCSTCSNRGLSLSCTYVNSAPHNHLESPKGHTTGSNGIQERISQLEGHVVKLMSKLNANGQRKQQSSTFEDQGGLPDSFGHLKLEDSETSYVGSSHWTAILDGISELKRCANDTHDDNPGCAFKSNDIGYEGPELLFGRNKYATKTGILASLPSRPVVDRLLSRYFNAMDQAPIFIHRPTFLDEYEQFWRNPITAPIMWIGMLYSMMCLAVLSQHFSEPVAPVTARMLQYSQDNIALIRLYREKTVQCLLLGKYTKPGPYTIETLISYFAVEYLSSKDTPFGMWIVVGIIVRLALRMGLHRDGSHSPQISTFQAEIRRRIWCTISQLDMLCSFQVGLPRMILDLQTDTKEPRNLLDDDINEHTQELPPARPDSELTPVLYLIAKQKLVPVFGKIADMATCIQPPPYAEIMTLDNALHDAHAAVPSGFKWRSMAASVVDQPDVVMQKIYLNHLFHKTRCVLHRRYLTAARTDAKYEYSRTSCIDAAIQLLEHQSNIYHEQQPGGQLYQVRWKTSSHIRNDQLLALTILCLDLDQELELIKRPTTSTDKVDYGKVVKIIQVLQESYFIWCQSCDTSHEAQKAAEALRILLRKASAAGLTSNGGRPLQPFGGNNGGNQDPLPRSAQSFSPRRTTYPVLAYEPTVNDVAKVDDPVEMFTNVDWKTWDAQFNTQYAWPVDMCLGGDLSWIGQQQVEFPN